MGLIEGGTAVLFAIVVYALFYGLAGAQVREILIADEPPGLRVFWFIAAVVVSIMVWAILGGFVYWAILVWFRIWLVQPHAWRQEILSQTGWFPFGLLFKHLQIPAGGIRFLMVMLIYPFTLLVSAGLVALGLRLRGQREEAGTGWPADGAGASARTKEIAR